jgi:hypothetical protein
MRVAALLITAVTIQSRLRHLSASTGFSSQNQSFYCLNIDLERRKRPNLRDKSLTASNETPRIEFKEALSPTELPIVTETQWNLVDLSEVVVS